MLKIGIGRTLATLAVGAGLLVAAGPASAAHTPPAKPTKAQLGSYDYWTSADATPVYGRSWRP